jgi:hypothetical protein
MMGSAATTTQGLPNVDPVYIRVRLAQRVPVPIATTDVPLVSGLTATVTIRDGNDAENGTLLQRIRTELETSFFGSIGGASARSSCVPGLSSPSREKAAIS